MHNIAHSIHLSKKTGNLNIECGRAKEGQREQHHEDRTHELSVLLRTQKEPMITSRLLAKLTDQKSLY